MLMLLLLACDNEETRPAGWTPGGPEVVDLAVGERGTCAVTGAGELWCWGRFNVPAGQVTAPPTRVAGLGPVVAAAMSDNFLCVRHPDASAACHTGSTWGYDGQTFTVGTPDASFTDVARITTGYGRALVVETDGALSARDIGWGYAGDVQVLAEGDFVDAAIAPSGEWCALHADGALDCTNPPAAYVPDAHGLVLGLEEGCVLDGADQPWCWRTDDADPIPATVDGVPVATDLALGDARACAVLPGGTVDCWGDAAAEDLSALAGIRAVDAGQDHVCGIDADGAVWCWGDDEWSQLGPEGPGAAGTYDGTGADPVRVTGLPG